MVLSTGRSPTLMLVGMVSGRVKDRTSQLQDPFGLVGGQR